MNERQSLVDLFHQDLGTVVSATILPLAALVAVDWQWSRAVD